MFKINYMDAVVMISHADANNPQTAGHVFEGEFCRWQWIINLLLSSAGSTRFGGNWLVSVLTNVYSWIKLLWLTD